VSLTAGTTWNKLSVTGSFSWEFEHALYGKDRDFSKTGNIFPYLVSAATGQGNIEGGYIPGDGVTPYTDAAEALRAIPPYGNSPASGYGNPLASPNTCSTINMFLNPTLTNNTTPPDPAKPHNPYCQFDSARSSI